MMKNLESVELLPEAETTIRRMAYPLMIAPLPMILLSEIVQAADSF